MSGQVRPNWNESAIPAFAAVTWLDFNPSPFSNQLLDLFFGDLWQSSVAFKCFGCGGQDGVCKAQLLLNLLQLRKHAPPPFLAVTAGWAYSLARVPACWLRISHWGSPLGLVDKIYALPRRSDSASSGLF